MYHNIKQSTFKGFLNTVQYRSQVPHHPKIAKHFRKMWTTINLNMKPFEFSISFATKTISKPTNVSLTKQI